MNALRLLRRAAPWQRAASSSPWPWPWPRSPRRALCARARADADADAAAVETVVRLRVAEHALPRGVARAVGLANASRAQRRVARKTGLIERFRRADSDTGSPEVQIALLTDRIRDLTGHVQQHRQDKHNRRRLEMMVHKRRRMMKYLLQQSTERYTELVKQLALRPNSVFSKDVGLGAKKAPTPRLH